MTEKSIHTLAQELKDKLSTDPTAAAREMIEFTKRFAHNPLLKREALMLKLDYSNAQQEDEKEHILEAMLVLINNVVKDYLQQPEADRIETQKYLARKQAALKTTVQQKIPSKTSRILFEGKGVGKRFKNTGFELSGIDLTLKIGQITGVVGENGNGKTTLFRICVGDLKENAGQIRFPDLEQNEWNQLNWQEIKKHIAYIPQELPKWHGSIQENLHYEATTHGLNPQENQKAVDYILHRLGLKEYAHRSWSALSGGYKLRFALAKALVWRPRLLVIDEPLANLDVKAQATVLNDLKNLSQSLKYPLAILISSQHLHEIERVADSILFLKAGKTVFYGNTSEVGKERLENSFEIECNLSLSALEEKLQGFEYNSLDHNGLVFIVHAPLHINSQNLLGHLLGKEVEIRYFRNISQSTKKLFVS